MKQQKPKQDEATELYLKWFEPDFFTGEIRKTLIDNIGKALKHKELATLKETLKWINEHKELFGKADYSYADLQIAEYLEAEIKKLEVLK